MDKASGSHKKKELSQKEANQAKKKRRRKQRNKNDVQSLVYYNSTLQENTKEKNPEKPGNGNYFENLSKADIKGIFYRKRNPKNNSIKLASFVNNSQKTCAFSSDPSHFKNDFQQHQNEKNQHNSTKQYSEKLDNNAAPEESGETKAVTKSPRKKKKEIKIKFPDYLTLAEVQTGLENGTLQKGKIRINPKNPLECYVSHKDASNMDYTITCIEDRNRAMEGDEVAFRLKDTNARDIQVVHILKKVHPRTAVGTLHPVNNQIAEVHPRDKRVPIIRIPCIGWPTSFADNPKQFKETLFLAQMTSWADDGRHAEGAIIELLGQRHDLRHETTAILRQFGIDATPHDPATVPADLRLSEGLLAGRRDLRHECVFTVDPSTARDLDDALSCKRLDNGHLEIGVHISDASLFLDEGSPLDERVKQRATSTYLVDNVYHMLPMELCLFHSLLPAADKPTFSVIWEMDSEGCVLDMRIERSIITSCVQLSYEHAQQLLDDPNNFVDLPPIHNGFTPADISRAINTLNGIAVKLRNQRLNNGCLRIDQIKITFSLDAKTGCPLNYWTCENKAAHRMIEEFMLLANTTVAEKLLNVYPNEAFLRCHESPKECLLEEIRQNMENLGIFFDTESSGSLSLSLNKYLSDDYLGKCRWIVLNHLLAKSMVRARYFCAGDQEPTTFNHYALSIPVYTHFTSPIRRYADIMVHRYLAAALGYRSKPTYSISEISDIADICNAQKYNAKLAGEASVELYLSHYINENPPFHEAGVVVDVKERSVDVIIINTGSIVRVYANNLNHNVKWIPQEIQKDHENSNEKFSKKLWRVIVEFSEYKKTPACTIVLEIFSIVQVELTRKPGTNKLAAKLLKPFLNCSN